MPPLTQEHPIHAARKSLRRTCPLKEGIVAKYGNFGIIPSLQVYWR